MQADLNQAIAVIPNASAAGLTSVSYQVANVSFNYESIKIGIGIEDWVRDGENVDTATDRVYKFVEDKLTTKIQEAQSEASEA